MPSILEPATSSRWWAGGRTTSRSSTAPSARTASRDRFSNLSCISPRSSARPKTARRLSPATLVNDEPTTFDANGTPWTPANYENEYDGEITLRRALAMSRNAATVKVAEAAGYDRVADLWRRIGAGTAPRAFPSIALGVFEATPFDIASAYTIFTNGGETRGLRSAAADPARRGGDRRQGVADASESRGPTRPISSPT